MTVGTTQLAPGNGHNYIINGAFDFWQRGTSFSGANNSTTFAADRFNVYRTGSVHTQEAATDLPQFDYALRSQRPSGETFTGRIFQAQGIETKDVLSLLDKTVTFSFYARKGSDFSGADDEIDIEFRTGSADDDSVMGYADGNSLFIEQVTLTNTWQRFSASVNLPAINPNNSLAIRSLGVRLRYVPSGTAGANDYFESTGWQLEAGSVATPFKRNANSIQGELAACQRYYQRFVTNTNANHPFAAGFCRSTSEAIFVLHFMNEMRANPTISTSGNFRVFAPTGRAVISFTTTLGSKIAADMRVSANSLVSGEGCSLTANSDADAYIDLDSEL